MKLLLINVVCGIRSTGRICTDIAKEYEKKGYEVKIAYGRETVPKQYEKYAIRIGNDFEVKMNALKARVFDNDGLSAKNSTKKFLDWASDFNPDIVWLHNLHGYYLNYDLLFKWIKSHPNMKVYWTLHDCWAFTGHCTYFTLANCYKWQNTCNNCIQKKEYPQSFFCDRSTRNFIKKKESFQNVSNMTIFTPSMWLAKLVKKSFLKNYNLEVKYNKVNSKIFKPTKSDFRNKYNLENKIILLGVASAWSDRKGLKDFIELNNLLDERFAIVLVGLNDKQIRKLPKGILGIKNTNDVTELAGLYTCADLFINPSREETFGMTTVEAISCGTEVIVYKDTACEEIVNLYKNGMAVNYGSKNISQLIIEKIDRKH